MDAESKLESIISRLRNENIHISLRYLGAEHKSANSDIQTVVENRVFFEYLLDDEHALNAVGSTDEFYCFLLIRKISKMQDLVSRVKTKPDSAEDIRELLKGITDKACKVYKHTKASAIKYINSHKDEIFQNSRSDDDQLNASLDFVLECQSGIDYPVFEYLCSNCFILAISRYAEISKICKKYPNLFSILFPSGNLDLQNPALLKDVLDIWEQEYIRKNIAHRLLIEKNADELCRYAESYGRTLSVVNVLEREPVIKSVNSFINAISSQKSKDLSEYVKNVERLKEEIYEGHTNLVQSLFKKFLTEDLLHSEFHQLINLTHLDVASEGLKSYLVPSSESYSMADLNWDGSEDKLSIEDSQTYLYRLESFRSAVFLEILNNKTSLDKYSGLIKSEVQDVSVEMRIPEEWLAEDTELLVAMMNSVAENINERGRKQEISCYSTSMFLCSLTEKLLRLFCRYLAKDMGYVPSDLMLGEALDEDKSPLTDVFCRSHIRHLAYFLIGTPGASGMKVGKNYRNRLAHWAADITPHDMTPRLVSRLLWLFTDVLNSVFIYFDTLPDGTSREEQRRWLDYLVRTSRMARDASMNDRS